MRIAQMYLPNCEYLKSLFKKKKTKNRDPGNVLVPILEPLHDMDRGARWATYSPWGHKKSDTTE